MDKPIKISFALIVKNEEKLLGECLESIKDADEIIICDTGSNDRTIEIAKQYTEKIYHFKWCDDFSKARNYANSKCTGDWIFSIDADHTLQTPIAKVKEIVSNAQSDVLLIESKAGTHSHHRAVLYKNTPNIYWESAVHECINKATTEKVDILEHRKSSDNHQKDPERNLRILRKSEKTPRNLFYLGRELFERKKYEEAIKTFTEYLEHDTWFAERAEAYICLAKMYWWTQKGDEARDACSMAIRYNPMFKEALLLMADMHYEPYKSKWLKLAEVATNEDVLFIRTMV
jgi:glycosyltransferase involved in cell wall biosynthesis